MNVGNFYRLRERIDRAHTNVYSKAHPGFTKPQDTADGSTFTVSVHGIKSPEQLEDELLTLFVWTWSMKDYLKELCRQQNSDPRQIEQIVNGNNSLMIAADVANRAKHGNLRDSRTGHYGKLEDVQITIPQTAIGSIGFKDSGVDINVNIPDEAEIQATITFESGRSSDDALTVAQDAVSAWETQAFPIVGV